MRSATRAATTSAALLAALLLASCGSNDAGADSTPTADAADTTEATETPEETEQAEEPSEEPSETPTVLSTSYAAEIVDFGAPAETTPPGTQLAFGQPAWVNQTISYGEEEITGGAGISVLSIQPLDASLFDQFSNAEEFEGFSPYAIIYQVQWLYDTPEGYDPKAPALFPIKEDGSDANYLTSGIVTTMFSSPGDDCGLQLPPYDEATRTLVTCFVGLTEDQPVVGAEFNGESYGAMFATEGNAYASSPVSWR